MTVKVPRERYSVAVTGLVVGMGCVGDGEGATTVSVAVSCVMYIVRVSVPPPVEGAVGAGALAD